MEGGYKRRGVRVGKQREGMLQVRKEGRQEGKTEGREGGIVQMGGL